MVQSVTKKELDKLKRIIKALNKAELKIAKKYVKAFDTNHTAHNHRAFQVLELIVKKPDIPHQVLRRKLCSDIDSRSFDRLLNRLYIKIQDSIFLRVNMEREKSYSEITRVNYDLNMKKEMVYILLGKGLENEAVKLLEIIQATSKEYELYNILAESMKKKCHIQDLRYGTDSYDENLTQIKYYKKCQEGVERAN